MNAPTDSLEAALEQARAEHGALQARLEALEASERKVLEALRARADDLDGRARAQRHKLQELTARAHQLERQIEVPLPARVQAGKAARAGLRVAQLLVLFLGLLMAPDPVPWPLIVLAIPVNLAVIWSLGNYLDRAELSDV